VDGPVEREVGGVDAVEDGAGLDLVEGEAAVGAPADDTPAGFEEPPSSGRPPPQVSHETTLIEHAFDGKGAPQAGMPGGAGWGGEKKRLADEPRRAHRPDSDFLSNP